MDGNDREVMDLPTVARAVGEPLRGSSGTPSGRYLIEAFRSDRMTRHVIVGIVVLVNVIVLHNAVFHPPTVGYDAGGHLRNVATLASFRLPTPQDSPEFFSPPLSYLLPALGMAVGDLDLGEAGRLGLIVQAAVSLLLSLFLLRLCELLRPGDGSFKIVALLLCGMPAVYYKTFSQVRGETWLALFGVVIACQAMDALHRQDFSLVRGIALGTVCGLALLARQWGALLLIGLACFATTLAIRRTALRMPVVAVAIAALVIAFMVSGWFYLSLRARYGSLQTFALGTQQGVEVFQGPRRTFSLSNAPREFYFGTGSGKLFSEPVRGAFPNQLGPIFYSETWGDYWSFFLVKGYDRDGTCLNGPRLERAVERGRSGVETNRAAMGAYLGRVNLAALLPSLVFLAGLVLGGAAATRALLGRADDRLTYGLGLLGFLAVASLTGYTWFVVSHYSPGGGSTIKATYMLQVFPSARCSGCGIPGADSRPMASRVRGMLDCAGFGRAPQRAYDLHTLRFLARPRLRTRACCPHRREDGCRSVAEAFVMFQYYPCFRGGAAPVTHAVKWSWQVAVHHHSERAATGNA